MRRLAIGVIAAISHACAPPVALPAMDPGPHAVRVTAGSDIVDGLAWSADRRLRWSDFLGRPDLASVATAVTAYVLNYDGVCNGSTFTFTVTATFLPNRSWVKPSVLNDAQQSTQALQHEQTHFDLGELHARRMRRELGALKDACERPEAELNDVVRRLLEADGDAQRQYDRETVHGIDQRRQGQWSERVRRELHVR